MDYSAVDLPEVGRTGFSWIACRNPMCPNFGISYDPSAPLKRKNANGDIRYKDRKSEGRFECRYCAQSFSPKSNQAVRPLARYYLSLSLPFATCPEQTCPNYGRNAFEVYERTGTGRIRHYRRESASGLMCRECERLVSLGEPYGLQRGSREVSRAVDFITLCVQLGVKMRRTLHYGRMDPNMYRDRLHRIGARVRDYSAWRNAGMFDPEAKIDFSQPARVYTDVMTASLRIKGDVERFRHLEFVVSVLALEQTFYILAAHPGYLPTGWGPPKDANFLDPKTGGPLAEFEEAWDCLHHPVRNRFRGTPEQIQLGQADVSRFSKGLYVKKPYMALAHLLVVRKMLGRFDRTHWYIDGARELIQGSVVALADDIQSKRAEVVVIQRGYEEGVARPAPKRHDMGRIGSPERLAGLRRVWGQTEPGIQRILRRGSVKRRKTDGSTTSDGEGVDGQREMFPDPTKLAAKVFKTAVTGADDDRGKWAWLTFPPRFRGERWCRSLWLTRMPDKTPEDAESPLAAATLQPVDSAINSMRARVLSMDRPAAVAAGGRGYNRRYYDPETVMAELAIYLLGRNFATITWRQKRIPAQVLRLMPKKETLAKISHIAKTFRLNVDHADTLSRWLRR